MPSGELTTAKMAAGFNEWMRRFVEEPERFYREFQQVVEFLAEEAKGKTPSYGQECAAYLQQLMEEMGSQ